MGGVLGVILPIFALIVLGAAARSRRLLDLGGLRGLTDLAFYLAIPALLFLSVIDAEALRLMDVAWLYFIAAGLVYAAGVVLGRAVLRVRLAEASVVGLNACYGNTGMLAVPMVAAAFGPDGVAVLMPVIALHSILLLPLATMLIEADSAGGVNPMRALATTVPTMLRNPVIVALMVGLAWRASGIPVPGALHRLLAMLAAAAPAVALFCLGATLPDFAKKGSIRETGMTAVLKLVVMPALVWLLARWAGLTPLQTAVAVVTAGAPTGANAFFLARRTAVNTAGSAGTVVLTTAVSVLTLSVLLGVLRV